MVADKGATPLLEELQQGACRNPHGFGFAIIAGDRIISERTMKAERSIERFMRLRQEYPDEIALWHARIATHGAQNENNCHPFRVGGDPQTYLAHNGILRVPMGANEHRSDSRVFAEDFLPQLGGVTALDNPAIRLMVEGWVGTSSKVAVLTIDPKAKSQCYIMNEEGGKWDTNNVWWSNQTHIKPKVYPTYEKDYDWDGTYKRKPNSYYAAHRHNPVTFEWDLQEGWYETSTGDFEREKYEKPLPILALLPPLDEPIEGEYVEITEIEEIDGKIDCPLCGCETDLEEDEDYCLVCHRCYGCGEKKFLCMCYNNSAWSGHFPY